MLFPVNITPQQYYNAIRAGNPTHVQMDFVSQDVVLDDSDINVNGGITLTDILCGDDPLVAGKATCKQLRASVLVKSKSRYMDWTAPFQLRFGVEMNGTTNWMNVGWFTGEKPRNVLHSDMISFVAYDYMKKLDVNVSDFVTNNKSNFPYELHDLIIACCQYCGVTAGSTGLLIDEYGEITLDVFMKYATFKAFFEAVADMSGLYVRINSSGACDFVWFTDYSASISITENDEIGIEYDDLYDGMTWDEFDQYDWDEAEMYTWDQIMGLVSNNPRTDKVMQINENLSPEYQFEEYPGDPLTVNTRLYFVESSNLGELNIGAGEIYNRIAALGGFVRISAECIGNWLVETGDIITIRVGDQTMKMPVFCRTLSWNGATRDVYEVPGEAFVRQPSKAYDWVQYE